MPIVGLLTVVLLSNNLPINVQAQAHMTDAMYR